MRPSPLLSRALAATVLLALALAACANVVVDVDAAEAAAAAAAHAAAAGADASTDADPGSLCARLDAVVDWSACSPDVRSGFAGVCLDATVSPCCHAEGVAAYDCLAGAPRVCAEGTDGTIRTASLGAPECEGVVSAIGYCLDHHHSTYDCWGDACHCPTGGPNGGVACKRDYPPSPSLPRCSTLCAVCQ